MKFLFILLSALFISCEDYNGHFQGLEDLELTNGDSIEAGDYAATLKIKSKKKIKIKLENDSSKHSFTLKLKAGAEFPQDDGTFDFKAFQNNQELDLAGRINTSSERSRRMTTLEPCQLRSPVRYCSRRCVPGRNGRPICYRVCNDNWGYNNGRQEVDYHEVKTKKDISLQIYANDGTRSGVMKATQYSKYKEEVYRGPCRFR